MFKLSEELTKKIESAINASAVITNLSINIGCGEWACSNSCKGTSIRS